MRKFLAMGLLVLASAAMAGNYGTAGCGVGSLIFGDKKGPVQLFAGTTNNFFSQTSSITSGTSNCTEDGVAMVNRERELFAEANFQNLRQEVAQGRGENVGVLAGLYGCAGSEANFGRAMQENYAKVGLAPDAQSMLQGVNEVLRSDAALSTACTAN
jgi:hypothetical protein